MVMLRTYILRTFIALLVATHTNERIGKLSTNDPKLLAKIFHHIRLIVGLMVVLANDVRKFVWN